MNFGFRYHVASLMAVFFSLILGILIGGALFPDHTLVEEQASLISELEERFRDVQANLVSAQKDLDFSTSAWEQLLGTIPPDVLATKTVVFVGEEEGTPGPLVTLLKSAGAEVKEVESSHLSTITPSEDVVFVVTLSGITLPTETMESLHELSVLGANLAFLWERNKNPSLESLPPGLRVDGIDTSWGKLAFILGLTTGSQGHYGSQKDAVGLFP